MTNNEEDIDGKKIEPDIPSDAVTFEKDFRELMECFGFENDEKANELLKRTKFLLEDTPKGDLCVNAIVPDFQEGISDIMKTFSAGIVSREEFQAKITNISEMIIKLTTENAKLKKSIQDLEEREALQQTKLYAYDLSTLYLYYASLKFEWRTFVNDLAEKRAALEDKDITQDDFDKWLLPYQRQCGLDLVRLSELAQDRHTQTHTDIRSTTSQAKFIQHIEKFKIPPSYSFIAEFQQMTKILVTIAKDGKLQRKV